MADILFYQNKIPLSGTQYYFDDILEWSDYELEVNDDYFDLLFPLNSEHIDVYKTNETIRENIVKATSRMLRFYGYKIVEGGIIQINKIERKVKGKYIGLYSLKNHKRITTMVTFLNIVIMELLSSLVTLALIYSIYKDIKLRKQVEQSGILKECLKTQKYIQPETNKFDKKIANFSGLKYNQNSCYQDSVLLALFAIPNDFITKNILQKDLRIISYKDNREILGDKDSKYDLDKRQAIQDELIRITKSMRTKSKEVQYCSKLRNLLTYFPSSSRQAFHETGTQDAGEFLQYLFSIFQVEGLTRNTLVQVTNDLSYRPKKGLNVREIEQKTSPIVLIPFSEKSIDLSIFVDQQVEDSFLDEQNLYRAKNGKLYRRRIEINEIKSADFLVFYVQRLISEGIRSYREIVLEETIEIDERLHLYAIVVHRNVHYTCYIKCKNGSWFYYNDLIDNIEYVGSFKDVLNEKNRPNVLKEGILYFYKKT